jgi:hypothetical protein
LLYLRNLGAFLALRRLLALVAGILIAVAPVATEPVFAHCPNVGLLSIAGANMQPPSGVNGAKATIQWTDPNLCQDLVNHGTDVLHTVGAIGWVQIGWIRYPGQTVKGYCEFEGTISSYPLQYWSVTAATHTYEASLNFFTAQWNCRYDGAIKYSKNAITLGFGDGQYIDIQG